MSAERIGTNPDADVHHWAWSFGLSYEFGYAMATNMNSVRELGQGVKDLTLPDRADIRIGDRGALLGDHLRRGMIQLHEVGSRLADYLPI